MFLKICVRKLVISMQLNWRCRGKEWLFLSPFYVTGLFLYTVKTSGLERGNGKRRMTFVNTYIFNTYSLTHVSPVSHFCTPWKRQEAFGFLTFSGFIEMWHWTKMGSQPANRFEKTIGKMNILHRGSSVQ